MKNKAIDKTIKKEDYQKVRNMLNLIYNEDFQGCLFIYDDNFREDFKVYKKNKFSLEDWLKVILA